MRWRGERILQKYAFVFSRLIFDDDENVSLSAKVFRKYLHLSSTIIHYFSPRVSS